MPMMDHDERLSGDWRPEHTQDLAGARMAIGAVLMSLCLTGVVCGGGGSEVEPDGGETGGVEPGDPGTHSAPTEPGTD